MTAEIDPLDLHAYVDRQLGPAEAARMADRLDRDPEARRAAETFARDKALLRAALTAQLSTGPSPERLGALERDLAAGLRRRRSVPRLWASAAALALFAMGAGSHALLQAYWSWRVPPIVEAATRAHEVAGDGIMRPVDIPASSDRQMAAWFGQHLGAEVSIPDLSGLGLLLIGGRLLVSPEGPMAQLLYQDRGANPLTVYLSATDTETGAEIHVVKVANYSAGYWQEGDFTYTIVADMDDEQFREVASQIAQASGFPHL